MSQEIQNILTRGVAEVLPTTQKLADLMAQRKIRLYLGIDPTGSLLTLGHAVCLKKLQQFADLGHEVILLIGNGTVRIGDPTGKDTTRPVLTDEEINENFKHWKKQAEKVLDFSKIKIVHNGDWLDALSFSDIIKLLAKTTVQQLMERDMFQKRVQEGKPVHGHEILYPLLQGYDSVEMEVDLEIGGTDQTFNMLMGRTLLQKYKEKEKWILTVPIINGTDGRKMSKSYRNFIALDEAPNEMFGKIMSMSDDQMMTYFEIFTDIDLKEAQNICDKNPRNAKVQLAKTIITWLHSELDADKAEQDFIQKFVKHDIPDDMPEILVEAKKYKLLDFSIASQIFASKGEARRKILEGAVKIDGKKILSLDEKITITKGEEKIFQMGKRSFCRMIGK